MNLRILTTSLRGGVLFLFAIALAPVGAAPMSGPGIVGSIEGGGKYPVELYVDNGDEVWGANDVAVQIRNSQPDGTFSFNNLDMERGYFVRCEGQVSPLQRLGEIQSYIDTFDITQSVTANPLTGFRMNSVVGSPNSILGGVRDFYVGILDGPAEAQLRSNPFSRSSTLQIDMAAGVSGKVSVLWDGVRGGQESDNGLDVDLTHGGMYSGISLRMAVDRAGTGQMLKLLLHSADGVSEKEVEFPVSPDVSPAELTYVPFDEFVGGADPRHVTAFQLLIDRTMPSLDARISDIGLAGVNSVNFAMVPEPTGGLLLLLGLALLAPPSRRRSWFVKERR